jgi:peptidyl-prolyl cis-trans isomerase D
MLQQIRDKITGWFAIVFLGAIAIVFIFWGIQFESSVNVAAAKVNGEKVPVEAVRRAWQNRQQELQQTLRDELPEELVKSEQQRLLEDFIRRELLVQRVGELGYRVSDRDLVGELASIPALQVDGQFSRDRYAALLRSQGRTEADFEAEFRRDLEISQLQNAVGVSAFALPGELDRRVQLMGETRDVQMLIVPSAGFATGVTVTDEQIAARYEQRKAEFQTPETVNLEYVQLTLAEVAAGVQVTDEALRSFYDQVAAERYATAERRQARHILIESGSDDAAAKARAEKLAAEAKGGADFAALAAQNSDDPGSKGQGGDLGWSTRESFVGPFSEALFAMSPGEVRGPVKTQFGYHVIKLEGIEPAAQRSFEDVRAELEADYRREQAQSAFYERSQQLADESFAALSELESVATKLGLELRTVEGFTRQGGGALGADRKVIDAVFSDDVLKDRQNSPAVNVGEESVVVLRVTEHKTPAQRPLEEVRAEVEGSLRAEAASQAAAEAARDAAARLAAGSSLVDVAKGLPAVQLTGVMTLSRNAESIPPELTAAVFKAAAPATGQTSASSTTLEDGSAVVFEVRAVRPGSLPGGADGPQVAEFSQQLAQRAAMAEFAAYVAELERTAEITRSEKVFE